MLVWCKSMRNIAFRPASIFLDDRSSDSIRVSNSSSITVTDKVEATMNKASNEPVKVGLYGAGGHVVTQHLPNLKSFDNAKIVAICDIDGDKAQAAATQFDIPTVYTDGLKMVAEEPLDALWSIVPAAARPAVEIAAAKKGIHLFCDKPQTLDMKSALEIDDALKQSGAMSTVCFRERYRPIFQEAKKLLDDKEIVHIRFQNVDPLPPDDPDTDRPGWEKIIEGHANFLGWGPHAIDYCRYVSGLDIDQVQAFFCERDTYHVPLSTMYNFRMSNSATMTMTFLHTSANTPANEPWFLFYYEGGYLAIYNGYSHIEMNGHTVYRSEQFQPWRELDYTFIKAIENGDDSELLNDFSDGLKTHAPLLAGWESSKRGGIPINIDTFVEESRVRS